MTGTSVQSKYIRDGIWDVLNIEWFVAHLGVRFNQVLCVFLLNLPTLFLGGCRTWRLCCLAHLVPRVCPDVEAEPWLSLTVQPRPLLPHPLE